MSIADELEKLEALYEDGVLSDAEFGRAKQAVIDGRSASVAVGRSVDPEYVRQQTNQWSMLLHFSQFANCIAPGVGLLAPIVIWQIKKNELPEIDRHGKVVVNWMISWFIYLIISVILCFVIIGIPLVIALAVVSVVFPVLGGIKANNGELWRYPTSISFFDLDADDALDSDLDRYDSPRDAY